MLRAVIQQNDSSLSPIKKLTPSIFLDRDPLHNKLIEIENRLLKLIENKYIKADIKVKMYRHIFNDGLKIKTLRKNKKNKKIISLGEEKKIQKNSEGDLLQKIEHMFKEQKEAVTKLHIPITTKQRSISLKKFSTPVGSRERSRSLKKVSTPIGARTRGRTRARKQSVDGYEHEFKKFTKF